MTCRIRTEETRRKMGEKRTVFMRHVTQFLYSKSQLSSIKLVPIYFSDYNEFSVQELMSVVRLFTATLAVQGKFHRELNIT